MKFTRFMYFTAVSLFFQVDAIFSRFLISSIYRHRHVYHNRFLSNTTSCNRFCEPGSVFVSYFYKLSTKVCSFCYTMRADISFCYLA